ncbi:MAG: DUF1674 domain-containing protein [Gammaproteobacteria bacterium]|nr:DUF1674 domain-containing protein [Gammaproteobacteria bacterium]
MSEQKQNNEVSESEAETTPVTEQPVPVKETGGPRGKEPTRYGDWEKNGRCIDF